MSRETVKQWMNALRQASKSGDSRRVKRMVALLDGSRGDRPVAIASKPGVAVSTV